MERYRGDELKLGDVSLSIGLERLDFHIDERGKLNLPTNST
jgi:hypothetical protein